MDTITRLLCGPILCKSFSKRTPYQLRFRVQGRSNVWLQPKEQHHYKGIQNWCKWPELTHSSSSTSHTIKLYSLYSACEVPSAHLWANWCLYRSTKYGGSQAQRARQRYRWGGERSPVPVIVVWGKLTATSEEPPYGNRTNQLRRSIHNRPKLMEWWIWSCTWGTVHLN